MPEDPGLSASVHASVPANELDLALSVLPGAVVTSQPPVAALAQQHPGARVLSVSSQDRLGVQDLSAFERLEAVVTRSTGCDRLPVRALEDHGVDVYHLDGYATQSVAQHTLMLLLMLLRRVPEATARTMGHGGGPPVWDRAGLQGRDLRDVSLGVLGTGRIGSAMVRLLSVLGARVTGFDVAPDHGLREIEGFRYAGSFDELLERSQALTLHVPLTPETRSVVDADALERLPPEAVLVNTARGAVVDQQAVAQALDAGRLSGYAADVLPGEPQPPELERLAHQDKVVLTPHLAAYDERALRARYETTARVTRAVLEKKAQALEPYRVPPHPEF